jgi:hypothetical protein
MILQASKCAFNWIDGQMDDRSQFAMSMGPAQQHHHKQPLSCTPEEVLLRIAHIGCLVTSF